MYLLKNQQIQKEAIQNFSRSSSPVSKPTGRQEQSPYQSSNTIQKIFYCPVHPEEKVVSFCKLAECEYKSRLLCSICQSYEHFHSEVFAVPLEPIIMGQYKKVKRIFYPYYDQIEKKQDVEKTISMINTRLDQYLKEYTQLIEDCRKNLLEQMKIYREETLFLEGLLSEVKQSYELSQDNRRLVENTIVGVLKKFEEKNSSQDPFRIKVISDQLGEDLENVLDYLKDSSQSMITGLKMTKDHTVKQALNFKFSGSLKAPSIQLKGQMQAINTLREKENHKFAMLEPRLPFDRRVAIRFKVLNISNYVGFGIGLRSVIQNKQNFELKHYGLHKVGCYMLFYHQYTLSHTDEAVNIQYEGFQFYKGDQIDLVFDPNKKLLKIVKNKNEAQFTFKIELPENDYLHAMVSLSDKTDEVAIIETIIDEE
ncbi:hypothetical protein ABPG74_003348 [Tetrahymena malaccensis]